MGEILHKRLGEQQGLPEAVRSTMATLAGLIAMGGIEGLREVADQLPEYAAPRSVAQALASAEESSGFSGFQASTPLKTRL